MKNTVCLAEGSRENERLANDTSSPPSMKWVRRTENLIGRFDRERSGYFCTDVPTGQHVRPHRCATEQPVHLNWLGHWTLGTDAAQNFILWSTKITDSALFSAFSAPARSRAKKKKVDTCLSAQ